MKISKFVSCSFVAVFTLACLFSFSSEAAKRSTIKYYPPGTATRAIQDLDDMLDDFIVKEKGEKLSPSEEEHNSKLKRDIMRGTFDIRELGKVSLAKHWGERTPAEQDEFVTLLTDLLEEKALFSKEQSAAKSRSGGKYAVIYLGEKYINQEKTKSFVKTKVNVPSENITITLNYKLKKEGTNWKIYDIIVDEASLVDNYRYQFNSIITKHGYPDLINRMKSKLASIKAQR
ncbi:MAG TPA: ABC transporter substrate-binding protein [bacterium]|nr:ABC transporter substrate-binding protein [Myxococcales bacterium]OQA61664.1 MAG: Toluene tolerance, Ttg2 [bacterium ADurb.Bin270]HPW45500.1 ABC transporter substrate-binding protein [bacterium]HQC50288.1 ABC transporter substrate-binding protein [bacterium]HQG13075.1 ABC transporter substrate-binding protein [bacterium]